MEEQTNSGELTTDAQSLDAQPPRHDSRPYFISVAAGAPVMVFPKRRNKKATARMWPETVEDIAEEGVCFAMEDKLESKNMEAQRPRHQEKQTDEAVPAVSQVIPLNSAYERAGLTPPVPLEELTSVVSNANRKAPAEDELVDPIIGNRVAGYVVEETVSAGGMGVVYRARQPDIGRCVAIKVLRPEVAASEEQSNRFFKEAQALSAIRHRGVTDIIQWGRLSDRRQYIVMEYLEGENLEDVMGREGAMPVYRVLQIIGEVLDALSAAHKAGVVHRDLKPSNIFIARQSDGTQCVKLLDFGLARQVPVDALEGGVDGKLDKASMVAGTPEYIAPEQARGLAATPRTDIYSLGVLTFEMLAGKLPFHSQSTVEMMREHAFKEAPDIRDYTENIPNTLAELLASMLKKLPEERPRSTDEVKQRLHRISQQLKDEDTQIATVRLPPPPQKEPVAVEPVQEKKLRKLWWPIAALPLFAGVGMYVGLSLVRDTPPKGNTAVETVAVVATPGTTTPVVATPEVATPKVETPDSTDNTPAADAPATDTPPQNTPGAVEPQSSASKTPLVKKPTTPVVKPTPTPPPPAVAVHVQTQEVDCTVPASVWAGAMSTKLSAYTQRITTRWRDEPEVRKKINSEFKTYQDKIKNSDDAKGTCEKISKDLDSWLRHYETRPLNKD